MVKSKKKKQSKLEKEVKSLEIPPDIPKEKTNYKPLILFTAISFAAIFLIGSVAGLYFILKRVNLMDADQSMITLIYVMGSGWFLFLPLVPILIIARKGIWEKFKVFGRRSKVVIVRLVGGDSNEIETVLTLKGNTMEIGENKIIINPRKATIKDGVKVMTYVADNALAHDFFEDKTKTLNQIASNLAKKKSADFHDIFSDPIRVDAKYFNETFLAAQQTNPDILKKIIAFLTSKNILVMLGAIAIAAAASAFLGLQANNMLNSIPFCNPTTITP